MKTVLDDLKSYNVKLTEYFIQGDHSPDTSLCTPSVWPHNPATRFRPPSATVVSAEPFSHGTGTLRCLQKEMATYRHWSVSLWRDPDDVSHCRILSPDKTEWRLISATLCGWRRCFIADQLWLMTRIREEDSPDNVKFPDNFLTVRGTPAHVKCYSCQ